MLYVLTCIDLCLCYVFMYDHVLFYVFVSILWLSARVYRYGIISLTHGALIETQKQILIGI